MITPDDIKQYLESFEYSPGSEHIHRHWGRVMVIWCHPHDGAALVIERRETVDPDDDDLVFDICERSDLSPAVGRQWPYLGFTNPTKVTT